ncbi:MAG TPA: FkbM family methyltransferase, partial [Candidatus Paceibacterota bacterium]|nr:FkbM family methyltransferase [Candidatus Paceibacterota bacterium]
RDENGNYILREHDLLILKKINFKDKNVLALGCGRGEELAYAIENGANIKNSVGVDFSSAAIKIAKNLFNDKKLDLPQFYTQDALDFVTDYSSKIKNSESKKFDIVIMFDFVEHVPREELVKILLELRNLLKEKAILVINTPAYKYDNDVIKNGYDERNQIDSSDTSDIVPETNGMHCNKYSLISLQEFMDNQGFINVTEAHYFISEDKDLENFENVSYYNRWNICKKNKFPILGDYIDDIIEFPYPSNTDLKLIKFEEGTLKGVSLLLTEEYKRIAYPSGNTDLQMINDISINSPSGKIIFDVGTFVGASSLIFSKLVGLKGKVLGFEPNPFNRNRSFINISNNPSLSKNIFIYPIAIGDDEGDREMLLSSEIDSGYSSTSRLKGSHSKLHDSELPEGFEKIFVKVKTLDAFVKENRIIPDIIKVDIEGAEHNFLLGGLETLRKYKPVLYIEIHSEYCAIRCFEILRSIGYSVTIINEEPDNRIMIKAEYSNKKGKILDTSIQTSVMRIQDSTFRLLNSVNKQINELTESFEISNKRIFGLEAENETLIKSKNELENKINNLEEVIELLENSKSWKITKPLRKITHILRKV